MALADDQVDDNYDAEADDPGQQGRDDQEDDPNGRVHAPGLRVAVHPQGAEDEGDDPDQADAEDEKKPLRSENLESARHPSTGGTALTLFHGCAPSLGDTPQALEDGTFRVELSVFAPLTGVLLTLSLRPQCSHSIQIRVER